jgi:hypothetical protein
MNTVTWRSRLSIASWQKLANAAGQFVAVSGATLEQEEDAGFHKAFAGALTHICFNTGGGGIIILVVI